MRVVVLLLAAVLSVQCSIVKRDTETIKPKNSESAEKNYNVTASEEDCDFNKAFDKFAALTIESDNAFWTWFRILASFHYILVNSNGGDASRVRRVRYYRKSVESKEEMARTSELRGLKINDDANVDDNELVSKVKSDVEKITIGAQNDIETSASGAKNDVETLVSGAKNEVDTWVSTADSELDIMVG